MILLGNCILKIILSHYFKNQRLQMRLLGKVSNNSSHNHNSNYVSGGSRASHCKSRLAAGIVVAEPWTALRWRCMLPDCEKRRRQTGQP